MAKPCGWSMNKGRRAVLFALILGGAFLASWLMTSFFPGTVRTWENQVHDQFFQLRYRYAGRRPVSPSVIHVDLDDSSIRDLSHSFSDKEVFARIIDILDHSRVRAVAFDMLFPNCDPVEACRALVSSTAASGRIYYPVILRPLEKGSARDQDPGADPPPGVKWTPVIKKDGRPMSASFAFTNFPELDRQARGVGHITSYPDQDGIFRRFPLVIHTSEGYVPSLSFRMVCGYLKVDPDRVEISFGHQIVLRDATFPDGRVKDISIPVDDQGRITINFAGPWDDSFAHYSVGRLLRIAEDEDELDLLMDELEGTMAIISDVSTGSRDVGPVPLENFYPLSGLHATVINSILKEDFLRPLSPARAYGIDLLLVILLLLAALGLRSLSFTVVGIMIYGLFLVAAAALFTWGNTLVNVVRPSFGLFLAVGVMNLYKYLLVDREKAAIRARFTSYFAPELIEKILHDQTCLESCEKKRLTILFSDIAGFTAWSADRSAEEVRATLNAYFTEMAEIVFRHKGTIDKYLGDGLMVFFGDPIAYDDHALRAVNAAVEMQRAVRRLHERWSREGGMPIRIRIGIHCGEVVVGNMGSKDRLEYTVLGANVNMTQRLESNAPVGGILVSEAIFHEVGGAVAMIPGGCIQLKGFCDEHVVYQVPVEDEDIGSGLSTAAGTVDGR